MTTAFKNKTVAEIRSLILGAFQEKFNKTFRVLPKSFINVIATVFAGVYITLYKQIGWLFLQMFPETAYWGETNILGKSVRPLVQWGALLGVGLPKNGTEWRGYAVVSVTQPGARLGAGSQLKSDVSGMLYISEQSVLLENETVRISVVCTEYGTAGNLEPGDILSFVSPFGFARRDALVDAVISYASDDETETEYRARVTAYFRNPPLGGALSDYRRWASDVPGVLNTYPCKDPDSPGGVFVYVSATPSLFPDRIPTPELLRQVGQACTYNPETGMATRKPIGAVIDPSFDESYINIKPVSIISFDVYIDGIVGASLNDFYEAVRPALNNYFLDREPYIRGLSDDNNRRDIISRNNVMSVVSQAANGIKTEFEDVFLMRGEETVLTYSLKTEELAKLDRLFLNGGLHGGVL